MSQTDSEYIRSQRAEAGKFAAIEQQMSSIAKSVTGLPDDLLPPEPLMNVIGSHDKAHFLSASFFFFQEFVKRGRLSPQSRILDIGCGCGRMAFPFELYLKAGKYVGIDVWEEGIRWCAENIQQRSSGFHFYHLRADNNYYFDDFKEGVKNHFTMPFLDDEELDFAFAISVFTHLLENDCREYFKELSRCLKSGAVGYLTCFLVDHFFWQYVERTGKHKQVKEIDKGVFQAYSGQDFFVGFSMEKWRSMLEENGLTVISFETGTWAEKPGGRMFQDTFLVVPTRTFK